MAILHVYICMLIQTESEVLGAFSQELRPTYTEEMEGRRRWSGGQADDILDFKTQFLR